MKDNPPKWLQSLWKKETKERFRLEIPVTYYEKLLRSERVPKHIMGYVDSHGLKCFVVE